MTTVATRLPPLMTVADFVDWPGDGTSTRYELVDGVLAHGAGYRGRPLDPHPRRTHDARPIR